MATYRCGHCGVTTSASAVQNLKDAKFKGRNATWSVFQCAACDRYTLGVSNPQGVAWFPPEGWQRVKHVEKVPELVVNDYVESVDCLVGGQYKAAAVMARRTVQGVCVDLGADSSKRLVDQIDGLKVNGDITPKLADLAHTIRVLGNDGAHPRKDGLDEMTEEEAQNAIEFVEHLLQHVYII